MRAITEMLCDASMLVAIFVGEPASPFVQTTIQAAEGIPIVSDFAAGEVLSALSIKVRGFQLSLGDAEGAISDFEIWTDQHARRAVTEPRDIALATRLVRRFDLALRMPDALYIALALRLEAPLGTLDRRQASAGRALGLQIIEPVTI
jgi:uncharacterized protein